MKEHYINWDLKKSFINILFWVMLAIAGNLLFGVAHNKDTWSSNLLWLSIVTPRSLVELLSHVKLEPILVQNFFEFVISHKETMIIRIHFHIIVLKAFVAIWEIGYYVPAHLKQSLGFHYKRKMWCYPQNCKDFNKRRKMAMDQELILK